MPHFLRLLLALICFCGSAHGAIGDFGHSSNAPKTPALFVNKLGGEVGRPNIVPLNQASRSTFNVKRLNYVVTEDGSLLLGRPAEGVGGGHIDLAGGAPVQAAGEVRIVGGQVRSLDNASGHYQPAGSAAQDAAQRAFGAAGMGRGIYTEKVWVPGEGWVPAQ